MTEQEVQTNIPETIPYARFKEVNDKKKELETQLAEMQTRFSAVETERDSFKKQAEEEKGKVTKTSLVTKYKLPVEMADRLRGETPEALEADAKALAELLKLPNPGVPGTPRDSSDANVLKTEEERVDSYINNLVKRTK